jgi:glycosyltransferase involved in cell wall biosynthesis
MRIAFVAREFYPFIGGGIAPIVAAAARQLAAAGDEVTVVTSAGHRDDYERLRARSDPRLPPSSVRMVFVEEPDGEEWGEFFSFMHSYSARAYRALKEAFPGGGPDVIEFCDYLGEGFVTAQAREARDPWLDDTRVCVRLHTTAHMCAVLDGQLADDFATVATLDAERFVLSRADTVLWPGGDVLGTYERVYGADALAQAVKLPDAFLDETGGAELDRRAPADGDALQLLYLGRLERRKGVQNLIRAVTGLDSPDVRLTFLGGDTDTAPLGASMRDQLAIMSAGDDRIMFGSTVPRSEVGKFIRDHHVVVIPSLWECWPNTAREALMQNRPVLATPVGGLCEMVQPGRSGWLARDSSPDALRAAIAELVARPSEVRRLIESGSPRAVFEELTDESKLVERYRALASSAPRARPRRAHREPPLVSVVIPYFKLELHVRETLESVAAQTYPAVETVIVNDGSLRAEDALVYDLAEEFGARIVTQVNSGLGAARNMGVTQSRGGYVLPLDADDLIAPEFVERCVKALEENDELAYVTSWVEYMDPGGTTVSDEDGGYVPFGNWSRLIQRNNVGGTCVALMRRDLFEQGFRYSTDLTSYEDWLLYLELSQAGQHGGVIPERLIRYRVRPESMMRTVGAPRLARLYEEIRAHGQELEVSWTAPGAA